MTVISVSNDCNGNLYNPLKSAVVGAAAGYAVKNLWPILPSELIQIRNSKYIVSRRNLYKSSKKEFFKNSKIYLKGFPKEIKKFFIDLTFNSKNRADFAQKRDKIFSMNVKDQTAYKKMRKIFSDYVMSDFQKRRNVITNNVKRRRSTILFASIGALAFVGLSMIGNTLKEIKDNYN